MTKIQLLEQENKDLKIQVNNSKNQIRNITEFIEEQRKAYESKIDTLNKRVDFIYGELDKANQKIDVLEIENKQLKNSLKQKDKEIDKLNLTITNLKSRINKDSSNSSKPPSSDGFKKKVHNTRQKTGKKIGGQFGHKGTTLKLSDEPTEIIQLISKNTKCDCGGNVHFSEECFSRKQVIDVEFIVKTIEYQNREGFCKCCNTRYVTEFPFSNDSNVHYGDNLKTLTTLLCNEGMVSINRIVSLIKELSQGKIKLSPGTVVNFNRELASKCEPVIQEIKEYLINSKVLFVDETGVRVNGKLNWLHTACTEDLTLYMVDEKRGNDATDKMGILAYYVGILMHDHLKSYYNYKTMEHAECNAHIIRYLKSAIEIFKRKEAQELLEFLVKINNHKKEMQNNSEHAYTESEYEKKKEEYLSILNKWKKKYLEVTKDKKNMSYYNDERCLIERLIEYSEEHLRFIKDFKVPFDNNLAERALRMIKTKMKVSGCFRSNGGSSNFAKIRSVIDTVKKRGINTTQTLSSIFKGNSISLN